MTSPPQTRIVVVDDSALFRLLIRDVLHSIPGCSVVGHAKDGRTALNEIEKHRPDLITLDVEMPEMDGIETLREMKRRGLPGNTLMVSRLTESGAKATTDALLEGAFDFILKPSGKKPGDNKAALRAALQEKISAIRGAQHPEAQDVIDADGDQACSESGVAAGIQAVIIGASTGGPDALRRVVPKLSAGLPVPVIVVQHMPSGYTSSLAKRLDEMSSLAVHEAADGDELQVGTVLIAPGGRQLQLHRRAGGQVVVRLTDDPPEHGCHPSIDYVLRSAVDTFEGRLLSVILTGMGCDGTDGCRLVQARGGQVIAQHADGCVVYGMPKSVITNRLAHRVIKLDLMAAIINREVQSRNGTD